MEFAMSNRGSKDIAKGRLAVPSHDPLPGVEEKPIDTGGTSGAELPQETNPAKPRRSRPEVVERGVDPDDLAQP
jgi:hypothetical protein